MIIGITGTLGAGKTMLVEFLKGKGFKHYSVSDYLTEIILERKMSVNRDSMVAVGNELRAKNSPSFLAEELYKKASQAGGDCIIESIRTEGEAEALRKKGEFYLIAVDADRPIRYGRIYSRRSAKDNVNFEKFAADEEREMDSNDPNKQNLKVCIRLADYEIDNSGSSEDLKRKAEEILREIKDK